MISNFKCRLFQMFSAFLIITSLSLSTYGSVKKIKIQSREIIKTNYSIDYEIIKGIVYFEVDPENISNGQIVDLKLAPVNSEGLVEFSSEFELHKPVDIKEGNKELIYFVNNRGGKIGNWHFNYGVEENWLYKEGYSYLWCGWNCDVPESEKRFNISVPIARKKNREITGEIYSEIISYEDIPIPSLPIVWGNSLAYKPIDTQNAKLQMRKYRNLPAEEIARDKWQFARFEKNKIIPDSNWIYLEDGIKPGWLYELTYTGKNPKVTGLGMAAIRDLVSFFKYDKSEKNIFNTSLNQTFAWGHSQSARLLNHFVYQNFNKDENNRKVFDGMLLNCAGAGKGLFNSRFAQFTRHGSHLEDNLYQIDFFPFACVEQYDPVTGKTGDAFKIARENGTMPKMMFVNSSTDYWTRGASLLHTDVEGKKDLPIAEDVRIYSVAGKAHTESRIGIISRALLTALGEWTSKNIIPPDSEIPKISDGTLVDYEKWEKNFPKIPGVILPQSFYKPYRLESGSDWETKGIQTIVPAAAGKKFEALVPQVDEDGNEIAGIRLPEIAVPLKTSNGWRQRNLSYSNSLSRNSGSSFKLFTTLEERNQIGDPRKSILERYQTKEKYINGIKLTLNKLKEKRLLLDEDYSRLLIEAAQMDYWEDDYDNNYFIEDTQLNPKEIVSGQKAVFTFKCKINKSDVKVLKCKFRESSNIFYYFNDEGLNADEVAGDGIWSAEIFIPEDVPTGQYHLDVIAINKKMQLIKNKIGENVQIKFKVKSQK